MSPRKSKGPPPHPVIAVIGDLVASRQLPGPERGEVQAELRKFVAQLNERYRSAVLSDFVITTGDEFQALLRDPDVIPDLAWELNGKPGGLGVRMGVGFGKLYTPLQPTAIGMDGPAFHYARDAINSAAKEGWLGGVFLGFSDPGDQILNGFARALQHHRAEMTDRQREVAALLRSGETNTRVAERLGITKQAVSDHVKTMGWEEYSLAEAGWRAALRVFSRTGGGVKAA